MTTTTTKKWQVAFLTKSTWCARQTNTLKRTILKHRSASSSSTHKCTISIHIDMAISQVFAQASRIGVIEPIEMGKGGFEEKNNSNGNGNSSRSRDNGNNNKLNSKCLCHSIVVHWHIFVTSISIIVECAISIWMERSECNWNTGYYVGYIWYSENFADKQF